MINRIFLTLLVVFFIPLTSKSSIADNFQGRFMCQIFFADGSSQRHLTDVDEKSMVMTDIDYLDYDLISKFDEIFTYSRLDGVDKIFVGGKTGSIIIVSSTLEKDSFRILKYDSKNTYSRAGVYAGKCKKV